MAKKLSLTNTNGTPRNGDIQKTNPKGRSTVVPIGKRGNRPIGRRGKRGQ